MRPGSKHLLVEANPSTVSVVKKIKFRPNILMLRFVIIHSRHLERFYHGLSFYFLISRCKTKFIVSRDDIHNLAPSQILIACNCNYLIIQYICTHNSSYDNNIWYLSYRSVVKINNPLSMTLFHFSPTWKPSYDNDNDKFNVRTVFWPNPGTRPGQRLDQTQGRDVFHIELTKPNWIKKYLYLTWFKNQKIS